jgi:hypothetical protein
MMRFNQHWGQAHLIHAVTGRQAIRYCLEIADPRFDRGSIRAQVESALLVWLKPLEVSVPIDETDCAGVDYDLKVVLGPKVQLTGRGSTLRVMTRLPVALTPGGTTRIRIAKPGARNGPVLAFELVEPPAGVSVARCESRTDAVDIVIQCANTVKPGTQGNLILQAFGERPAAKESKGASRVQRTPLGLVPAIPFDVIAPSEPST